MRMRLLHLDGHSDRLDCFRNRNPGFQQYELFDAIEGSLADRTSLIASDVISSDLAFTDAALGNALTHLMQWRDAIHDDVVTTVIEDDAVLAANFSEETDHFLSTLPDDWDYVLWGWRMGSPIERDGPGGHGSNRLRPLHSAMGVVGYSISPQGAEKLLDHCLPLRPGVGSGLSMPLLNNSIDTIVASAWPDMKAYVAIPPLAMIDPNQPLRIDQDAPLAPILARERRTVVTPSS